MSRLTKQALQEAYSLMEELTAYTVHYSWDEGDKESGPMPHDDYSLIRANSEDEACDIWLDKNKNHYNNLIGVWAEPASKEESEKILWDDLSGSEQMAVEFAEPDIQHGVDIKTAALNACYRVSEGNAEPEYEGEDFYQDEPDYKKVVIFLEQEYGVKDEK